MTKLLLGTSLTLGLMLSIGTATMASPGDGLDRDAARTGNTKMGEMHRNAVGGSMMDRSMRSTRMMKHRRPHRHHRRSPERGSWMTPRRAWADDGDGAGPRDRRSLDRLRDTERPLRRAIRSGRRIVCEASVR